MPAFFSRRSGLLVDTRLDTPEAVAQAILARQQLNLQSGMLVTVPVVRDTAGTKSVSYVPGA